MGKGKGGCFFLGMGTLCLRTSNREISENMCLFVRNVIEISTNLMTHCQVNHKHKWKGVKRLGKKGEGVNDQKILKVCKFGIGKSTSDF